MKTQIERCDITDRENFEADFARRESFVDRMFIYIGGVTLFGFVACFAELLSLASGGTS